MKHFLKSTLVAASLAITTGATWAEEFTMNAVSMTPRQASISAGFAMFIEEINNEFKGEFQIKWRGGPEVMPPFKQAEAVRNGAIDMAFTSPSYYSGLVPSSTSMNLSFKRYDEINQTGYYERMTEIHAEKDLVFLGEVPATDLSFLLYLNAPITSLDDLKGKRVRVFPTLAPLVEALGAEPLILPIGEIYTAMERGTIDGFAMGPLVRGEQYKGVVSTVVYPGVYRAGFPILVNQDAWNEMPQELRDRITAYVRGNLSSRIDAIWAEKVVKAAEGMAAEGFSKFELSSEDAVSLRELALDAAWAGVAEAAGEEQASELRSMLVD
ncbi:TRAP transporter substrate-binding protein DctP [Sedimentitalea nanhaiensis]|uniref:TRAP-type C4-dicarboxylate transport system, substrate-binding protein n=1 Tax=Sedimentitalea nanhaiensis TaxID=999627 RepID=A0A1I7EAY7_9RHOB|nr:TRAP transporter substrate-binding protein DctP [Sedimentitalea nanhaiensis]SFU21110.1 TRAP-type C4-dicarboxylate transport system, substrate-binding protein [Sedimentitalea nanhaiensis]